MAVGGALRGQAGLAHRARRSGGSRPLVDGASLPLSRRSPVHHHTVSTTDEPTRLTRGELSQEWTVMSLSLIHISEPTRPEPI
eukprot:6102903-Pyramimonas_sp.AAC.1